MKSAALLLLLSLQIAVADNQAALTTEIKNALKAFYDPLLTSDTPKTFNAKFEYEGRRVFEIEQLECTLEESTVTCTGGTLAIGPEEAGLPTLNLKDSTLQYGNGMVTGVISAEVTESRTMYGLSFSNIEGEVALDASGISEVSVSGDASVNNSPKYEVKDMKLKIKYERGQETTVEGSLKLLVGLQGEDASFPQLNFETTATLGSSGGALVLQGSAEAAWLPAGTDGPSVDSLSATVTLTDAGLARLDLGPFEFQYAEFVVNLPSGFDVSQCEAPTCTSSWWGRRSLLFSSLPSVLQPGSRSGSATVTSFCLNLVSTCCSLNLVDACELKTTASKLPIMAKGNLNIDVENGKAWGSIHLKIKGTVTGPVDVSLDIDQEVFPYNEDNPLDISSLLENAEVNLCGFAPAKNQLAIEIPAITANSRGFVPAGGIPFTIVGFTYTLQKNTVPSYTFVIAKRTVNLGDFLVKADDSQTC